jgi:hypothetical protein
MKTQWLLLTAACILLAGSAFGQITTQATADVPFEFVVNHNTFPKGEYIIRTLDDGPKLVIQNKTQPEYAIFVLNIDVSAGRYRDGDSKMIFSLNNGQYVLHQIFFRGDNHIHNIVHGSDVIELAQTR